MKPILRYQTDWDLLLRIETGEGLVEDLNMQSAFFTMVFVTSGPPMLPLSDLFAVHLLPHLVRVIEAFGFCAVIL